MKEPREIVLNDPNSVYPYIKELWEQIAQAKEIIKKLLKTPRTIYKRDEDGEVCPYFNSDYEELEKQAEQFLSSSEKANN